MGPFQEVWFLKLNDPARQRALWLRFTTLTTGNGFKRVAETWGIFFERSSSGDVRKIALKQTHDLSAFRKSGPYAVRIGDCELSETKTNGTIQAKGNTISWDLAITNPLPATVNFIPETLKRLGIVKNSFESAGENLRFTGQTRIGEEVHHWTDCPGMLSHIDGPKNGHAWVWGQCNSFVNTQNPSSTLVFDGITARARSFGSVKTPPLSSFYFQYAGKNYGFHGLWDALRIKSAHTLTEWKFRADRGDLSFRGTAQAEHKDFAGVTYEDTDGSFLYCANSKLSNMTIWVYRRDKLEATFTATGTAAFEVVSREKNPYVPLLI